MGKKWGVDWYALTHAIVSALGSIACSYLDVFASETLTGTPEPLRSCQCAGPLTSLHKILPAITMGYSLFDLIDGMTISVDFMLHGLATFAVMAFFLETGTPNFITPMLLMEASTPFLTIVRAEFFTPMMAAVNQAMFMLSFFAFRIVITPYLWYQIMVHMFKLRKTKEFQECFPWYFMPVCLAFGMFFNCLNGYWFIKIVKKARRKILGIEHVKANNDLSEAELKHSKKDG